MNKNLKLAQLSLAFLWLYTGIVSIFISPKLGVQLLSPLELPHTQALSLVWCGGILDIAIGVWILSEKQQKQCYLLQSLIIMTYTIIITLIDFSHWYHPFGPVSKNIPILVLIWILYSQYSKNSGTILADKKHLD